ncbi:hypothetical protein CMO89_03830 [Candidatus Woesearchaeota archaeon]|nr:hypothetical protein [Candidatus Woesearchaeota archaeon]|tara:strand:- start:13543 stop:14001 length:459 start_codon:yes stop_codon:yes gene_type:complete
MPLIGSDSQSQPKPEHKGLFGGKEKPKQLDSHKVDEQLINMDNRLRVIEERTSNLQRRYMVTEQNMLSSNKKFSSEFKTINLDINEIKKEISQIRVKVLQIIEELKKCARKEEITMIKRYVDMWEPINFVTRKEVEKIIGEMLQEKLQEKKL